MRTAKPFGQDPAHDYERIRRAIDYLRSHHLEQPELDDVARSVHLSPHHFQRLFTRWAGVSPKRFLQFLTVEHAKRRLAENRDVLTVTMDAGLSSPGRLHDLFINVEAMTPGEFKLGGAGMDIRHGVHGTPFGRCVLAVSARGVCGLAFVTETDDENMMLARLHTKWPRARLTADQAGTEVWAKRIFTSARRTREPLRVLIAGTNFQMKVWEALLRIAPGGLASYDAVAAMIGSPQASRAVGSAIGRNDIAYLIPCHRVINKSGLIGNYRWGTLRKQTMIGWEAARHSV